MLNFGASKPRVKGGPRTPGAPLDPRLVFVLFATVDSDRILAPHFVLMRKYLAGKSSQGRIASSTRHNNKIDDIIIL